MKAGRWLKSIGQSAQAELLNESESDKEPLRIFRDALKPKVQAQIPIPGLLIDGVQYEGVNSDVLAGMLYLRHGSEKHALAELLSLASLVDCKLAEQDHPDGTGWEPLLYSWQLLTFHGAGHKSKVALDLGGAGSWHYHVGYSQVTVCVLPGLLAQKTVEWLFTAVKGLPIVTTAQILNEAHEERLRW